MSGARVVRRSSRWPRAPRRGTRTAGPPGCAWDHAPRLDEPLVHAVHAAVGVFALLVEERGKVLLPPAVGDEPRRGGVPVLDACRAAASARSRLPASRRGRLPVSSRMLACTWCVLLQYLLGGFGSVFPQCGLMVFPVSSSFPGDVRGIGAAACIFPSCDSNWIRPHAFQRHKRGNS